MDVTKNNFIAVLGKFEDYLKRCEFVSIDEEMTGMRLKNVKESCFDTANESYFKKRSIASAFGLIQLGVCLFEKGDSGTYIVRPFNFFCFPSSDAVSRVQTEPLVLDPDGIDFHRRHNMDFQRWIYEGVGYCTAEQETQYRAQLIEYCKPTSYNGELKGEDLAMATKIIEFIQQWLSKKSYSKEVILPQTDNRIVQKYIKAKLPDIAPGYDSFFRGKQWILGPNVDYDKSRIHEERLLNFTGVREIFKLLVKHRKPLVGHNMLMDLFFLIRAVDQEIPSDISEFQAYLSQNLPSIWDTKVLGHSSENVESKFKSTSLQNIFTYYSENPVFCPSADSKTSDPAQKKLRSSVLNDQYFDCIEFPLGFERYATILRKRKQTNSARCGLAHEAAYDALMTGFIFLQFKKDLGMEMLLANHNFVAVPKNYQAICTSVNGISFKKICQGPVLRLEYENSHDLEVDASVAPLKGKVEWRENGTAAAVLSSVHSCEDGITHYKNCFKDIKAFPFL